jgi:hypothetical protein
LLLEKINNFFFHVFERLLFLNKLLNKTIYTNFV